MKVAIYAISKNEIKHVERFMLYSKEADCVIIGDTGSTDGTPQKLRELGATVYDITISPWRFDRARNAVLQLIPNDVDWVISVDLDEFIVEGWRKKLEREVEKNALLTKLTYMYTWNWKAPNIPDYRFPISKLHKRHGYQWVCPCHEIIAWAGEVGKELNGDVDIEIEHHADQSKSRSSYMGLLEMGVKESPQDDRRLHYLGREYFYARRYQEAVDTLTIHISLPYSNSVEKTLSMRQLAESHGFLGDQQLRTKWLLRACAESMYFREPWLDLAQCFYDNKDYDGVLFAAKKALGITERHYYYTAKSDSWGPKPYDFASIGSWYTGNKEDSYKFAKIAYDMNKSDKRLMDNYIFISKALDKKIE